MPKGYPKKKEKLMINESQNSAVGVEFNFLKNARDVVEFESTNNGCYNLYLKDGSIIEKSLDPGEIEIISDLINYRKSQKEPNFKSEGLSPSASMPKNQAVSRSPLDRNVGHWQTLEAVDPNKCLYWPTENLVPFYRQLGYDLAKPGEVKDYNDVMSYYNPGGSKSPGSPINYMGHVLMITTKENKKRIEKEFYKDRPMNFVEKKRIEEV